MPTVADLGWTSEYAAQVRALFVMTGWAEGWDDPDMDVYDDIHAGLEDIEAGRVEKFSRTRDLLEDKE